MANLKQILLTIRSGGLRHSLDILKYTLHKQQLDAEYRRHQEKAPPLPAGKFLKSEPYANGCIFHFENANLEVVFLAPDLARLNWAPGLSPNPYAILRTEWPAVDFKIIRAERKHTLQTSELQLAIHDDARVFFLDAGETLLRSDLAPERSANQWSQMTETMPGEFMCGLGTQAGPANLLDRAHTLWGSDPGGNYGPGHDPLYMPLPVYYALHDRGSYLVFYENASKGEFLPVMSSPATRQAKIIFESGVLRYYFIPGPPERAMRRYTELTGRSSLPPLWSLGYHQSRWGYKSEKDIRLVIEGFHQHDLPISAIHLDIDYMHTGRAFTFDPDQFPDVQRLTRDLHDEGIRLVTIIDPGVKIDPAYDIYHAGLQNQVFCSLPDGNPVSGMLWLGRTYYPDFTNPSARNWWGGYYQRMCEQGIDGFWHDMNEPTSFVAWGDLTLPNITCHNLEGRGGDHLQAHNLYGMQMNRSAWDALRQLLPDKRPWILSRSGWAGGQRYAWNWTADTDCTWESLRMNLISILGLAMSGFAYTGPDIGGFSGDPSAELYLRWFQMASFLPFFRTHSAVGTAQREPWVFGEPYTTIIRKFLQLRYSLLPYIYTLAWIHTQTGAPLTRPLFWDDWKNPRLRHVDDTFMLGETLLIAPILEENSKERKILFPEGRWYNFWDDHAVQMSAGQFVVPITLDRIPVFVRGGTVLPIRDGDCLILRVYMNGTQDPPDPGNDKPAGILYSDAGDGYGSYRIDRYYLQATGDNIVLTHRSEGDFGFPYASIKIQLTGGRIANARSDGSTFQIIDGMISIQENFRSMEIEMEIIQ